MPEKIVQLNEEVIKGQIKELVRGSVEETLSELLEAEAEKLTQAARYKRNEQHQGYRSGHYNRNLITTSGDVTLKVPKLKGLSFETAIIERYRRREAAWKKPSSKCIWPAYPSGVWRTSPRLSGAAKSLPLPSASGTRKRMLTWRIGGTVLCRLGGIRLSMWMESTCAATGAESLKM